jgi:hypothetical protein
MVDVWLGVLADIPGCVLSEAVVSQAKTDAAFMPKPGEFLALCQRILSHKEIVARRAEALAAGPEDGEDIEQPREISDADREAMKGKLQNLRRQLA